MNKAKDIQEGNKLIAVFMGAEEEITQVVMSTIGNAKAPTGRIYFPNRNPDNMHLCLVEDLRYHKSWDWLMPVVVEKIKSLLDDKVIKRRELSYTALYIFKMRLMSNIVVVWKAVIQFITWYNQNKTS